MHMEALKIIKIHKMINDESKPRQNGLQTNRLPTHARTVMIRVRDNKLPLQFGYFDGNSWRYLNRDYFHAEEVVGWMEMEDAARLIDSVDEPSDA